jgi:hypothetical protein
VLTVSAMSVVQPAVAINPSRVVVQDAHLTNDWKGKVAIRSGLNRPLKLANAKINVPGSSAEIRELEAGSVFEVSVVLPLAAKDFDQPIALTLKSNFPDYETVQVPILVVNSKTAVTADGIPLTARANKFINSPEGRRALEARPEDYLTPEESGESHEGHNHPPITPK